MSACLYSPEQLAWYKIRDLFFGTNGATQNLQKALELAAICEHPDAVWLTKLFVGRHPAQARHVFLECKNNGKATNNGKAICFGAAFDRSWDNIKQAADLGDAYAQSIMAIRSIGKKRFKYAQKSAAQGERDGFYWLGHWYYCGRDKNRDKAKENFLIAANLGYIEAMFMLVDFYDEDNPQRFVLLGKAAVNGANSLPFLTAMEVQLLNFKYGTGQANIVFAIGRVLKGHIDNEKQTVFGLYRLYRSNISFANQAFLFYEYQLKSYRNAVDIWTIIGKRLGVVKDIRKMIGLMIWDSRDDAKYTCVLDIE